MRRELVGDSARGRPWETEPPPPSVEDACDGTGGALLGPAGLVGTCGTSGVGVEPGATFGTSPVADQAESAAKGLTTEAAHDVWTPSTWTDAGTASIGAVWFTEAAVRMGRGGVGALAVGMALLGSVAVGALRGIAVGAPVGVGVGAVGALVVGVAAFGSVDVSALVRAIAVGAPVGVVLVDALVVGVVAVGVVAVVVAVVGLVAVGVALVGALAVGALAVGVLAVGALAAGVVLVGALATGVVLAVGALAVGVLAVGVLVTGVVLAVGALAVGVVLAVGAPAVGALVGVLAVGALAVEVVLVGALSVGALVAVLAVGALAVGVALVGALSVGVLVDALSVAALAVGVVLVGAALVTGVSGGARGGGLGTCESVATVVDTEGLTGGSGSAPAESNRHACVRRQITNTPPRTKSAGSTPRIRPTRISLPSIQSACITPATCVFHLGEGHQRADAPDPAQSLRHVSPY